mgnify:CR=1 FL=1
MIDNLVGEKSGFIRDNRCAMTCGMKCRNRFFRMGNKKSFNRECRIIELVHARDMRSENRCIRHTATHGKGFFNEPRDAFTNEKARFRNTHRITFRLFQNNVEGIGDIGRRFNQRTVEIKKQRLHCKRNSLGCGVGHRANRGDI